MANSPCGVNAAMEEAAAGIDNLKASISGGLDSIGSIGALTDTIKAKLAEANPPKPPSMNLQEELAGLPYLTPDEYTKRVTLLKAQFGSSVPGLDESINKIPKPAGLTSTGVKDIFADLQNFLGNAGAAFQNVQDLLSQNSLDSVIGNVCKDIPNVEVEVVVDAAGNAVLGADGELTYKPAAEKAAAPVSPTSDPAKETKPDDPPSKGFTFSFTKDKLQKATNSKAAEWYNAMNTVLPKYGITTPERVAVFLGQITAEAGANLSMLKESSAYKAPAYFSICQKRLGLKSVDECAPYLATPEKTFQGLYESTLDGTFHYMGLNLHGKSVIMKGDGAKFCGRGLKQLTGRANYARASREIYGDDRLLRDPEQVATDKEVALETACWFWKSRNLNGPADKFDIITVTKLVNGGDLGLATRKSVAEKALAVFKS